MKSIIVSAKTVEKAIEEGLQALQTTLENVDINVISEGGLLKKAKVEITIVEQNEDKISVKTLEKVEKTDEIKPNIESKKEEIEPVLDEEDIEIQNKIKEIEEQLKELTKNEETVETQTNEKQVVDIVKEFLDGLIYAINCNASVEVVEEKNSVKAKLIGENLGIFIGYHGESLEALQYLINNVVYNKIGKTKKIILDVENYRNKRQETLEKMAENLAKRVLQTKKSYKLEPMNSFERKIIHTHLQNFEHIATHSEGKEPNRCLIISYEE